MEIVRYSLFILTFLDLILHARGSGSMYDPPNRAVMWKYGYNTRKNYNYMQLNCGGEKQYEKGPFKCGVCGDPYNEKKEHEDGGKYGTKLISRYYPAGIKEMSVKVELLAFEKGFFEFRLCNADLYNVTQECFDENILPIKEGYLAGTPLRFFPKGAGDFRLTVAVPPKLTCNRCVLQWRYHTANSWGTDPITNEQGIGLGPQEEFRNCADIRIGGEIPKSVRNNPFFAPPDARAASAIDKPTDQRKRLAVQNNTMSVKPASVDHLSLSARILLHGTSGAGGITESNMETAFSGGSQSVSGWETGATKKETKSSNRVPDLVNRRKQIETNTMTNDKRADRKNMMLTENSMGNTEQKQTIVLNDLNAKQQNGFFPVDDILHGTSQGIQSGDIKASEGTVKRLRVHSMMGGHVSKEISKSTHMDGNRSGQFIHGTEHVGGHLKSGSMDGKKLTHFENRISTSNTEGQSTLGKSQSGSVDNQLEQFTSSVLGSNRENLLTNSLSTEESINQKKKADQRVIGSHNVIDMTVGIIGPAPKPQKKASAKVLGASISKTIPKQNIVPLEAATRSGLALSRDKKTNQRNKNNVESQFFGTGMSLDLTGMQSSSTLSQIQSNAQFQDLSNIRGMTTETGQKIVNEGKEGSLILKNENPLTISDLQPQDGRQRIFLVKASRPQGVMLSSSKKGSLADKTISESQGTGIVRTAVDKTVMHSVGDTHSSIGSDTATLTSMKPIDNLGQQSSVMLVSSLNPLSQSDNTVGGRTFSKMTASEVIDPLRTQTQRSDGVTVSEKDILPASQKSLIAQSKSRPTSEHTTGGGVGKGVNDIDAFRKELVKSSLRQGGAFIADLPADNSNTNTQKDAVVSKTSDKQLTESKNAVGTSILLSNEIGGKSDSSLGQTVSKLLNEAEKILSQTTADISKAQTATASSSKKEKAVKPVKDESKSTNEKIKTATQTTSSDISASAHKSHHSSVLGQSDSSVGASDTSHVSGINEISPDKTIVNETPPLRLSLEYLLGKSDGNNDRSNRIVESSHRHQDQAMHINDINSGSPSIGHTLSSTSDIAHMSEKSPRMHVPTLDANPSVHSSTSHSNAIGISSGESRASHGTSGAAISRSLNLNAEQGLKRQSSNNDVHSANVDFNPHATLLSNLDIIGPDTGIVLPTIGFRNASNTKEVSAKSSGNKAVLDGIGTTNGGRLGGNIIDFSSNTNTKRKSIDSAKLSDSQVNTNDFNRLASKQALGQDVTLNLDSIVKSNSKQSLGSSDRSSTTGNSAVRTTSNQQQTGKAIERHNLGVHEPASSKSERRRIVGGNNIVSNIDRTRILPSSSIKSQNVDNVGIERQLSSFNLDNIPSSSVMGTGVQMSGDGVITAGFGPRDLDITNFRLTTDPRSGLEERVHVGETTRGIHETGVVEGAIDGSHTHTLRDHSNSGQSNDPVYFLDMTRDSSSGSGMIDSLAINELPPIESRRILSDSPIIGSGERRLDSTRQTNIDLGARTIDRLTDGSSSDRRILDNNHGEMIFDMRTEGLRSRTGTGTVLRDGAVRSRTDRRRSFGRNFESGPVGVSDIIFGDVRTREGSRGRTNFVPGGRSIVSSGRSESSRRTDERSAGTSGRFSGGDLSLVSGRRAEWEQRVASGMDLGMTGSERTSGTGPRFIENSLGLDSMSKTGGNRRSVDFDTRIRGSDTLIGEGRGFRDRSSRIDTRRSPRGEERRTAFDFRMGGSGIAMDSNRGFREGSSRLESRRPNVGIRRGTDFDVRMEGTESSVGAGGRIRDGSSRLNSRRRSGERRLIEFDTRIGGTDASGLEGLRMDPRGSGSRISRDGSTITSTGRRESGSRSATGVMSAGASSFVPSGGSAMSSIGGSLSPMLTGGGFGSGMPSFAGPFSPTTDSGLMMSGPGMPLVGGFSSIDPAFGPSLGGPGMFTGIGPPGIGPPSIGPGLGMPPPFSPMPFGPVML